MVIPQIRNTLAGVLTILLGSPAVTVFHLWLSGELKGWHDLPDVLNHSMFTASMIAIGWVLFRSPFAGKITEILQQTTTPTKQTTTQVTISESPAEVKKAG